MCKTFLIGAMKPVSLLFDYPMYDERISFSVLEILDLSIKMNITCKHSLE